MKIVNKLAMAFAVAAAMVGAPALAQDAPSAPAAPGPVQAADFMTGCQRHETNADFLNCLTSFDAAVYAVDEIYGSVFGQYYPNQGMAPQSCNTADKIREGMDIDYYAKAPYVMLDGTTSSYAATYFNAQSACMEYKANQIEAGVRLSDADTEQETARAKATATDLRAAALTGSKMAEALRSGPVEP
jgi:hypothetical protein